MRFPRWQWWWLGAVLGLLVFFLFLPVLRTVYWRGVAWWWEGSAWSTVATETMGKAQEIAGAVAIEKYKAWQEVLKRDVKKYFKQQPSLVIARADPYRQLYFINRGKTDGLVPGQAVLSPSGFVIAQVAEVWEETATILLLTDNDSRISARILGEAGRTPFVLAGDRGLTLRLLFVGPDLAVRPGDRLVSGGQDKLIPPGLALGEVESVEPSDREGLFQKVIVETPDLSALRVVGVLVPLLPSL